MKRDFVFLRSPHRTKMGPRNNKTLTTDVDGKSKRPGLRQAPTRSDLNVNKSVQLETLTSHFWSLRKMTNDDESLVCYTGGC